MELCALDSDGDDDDDDDDHDDGDDDNDGDDDDRMTIDDVVLLYMFRNKFWANLMSMSV